MYSLWTVAQRYYFFCLNKEFFLFIHFVPFVKSYYYFFVRYYVGLVLIIYWIHMCMCERKKKRGRQSEKRRFIRIVFMEYNFILDYVSVYLIRLQLCLLGIRRIAISQSHGLKSSQILCTHTQTHISTQPPWILDYNGFTWNYFRHLRMRLKNKHRYSLCANVFEI